MEVLPYLYKLTHKETGQFYIGFREANTKPAIYDLGRYYKSSSAKVKELGYHNFIGMIIAEFDDRDVAYEVEQKLIEENYNDPLCINAHYTKAGMKYKHDALSEEARIRMSRKGTKMTEEQKKKISASQIGKIMPEGFGKKISEFNKLNGVVPPSRKGTKWSEESKQRGKEAQRKRLLTMDTTKLATRTKQFILVSPSGHIFEGSNLKQFCLEHGLKQGAMAKVCRGQSSHHHNWTGSYKQGEDNVL